MAADSVLEYEVITTRGDFIVASPTKNEDLYWALSGGVRKREDNSLWSFNPFFI